jgi:serine/threonine-protein kinase RsbW
MGTGNARSPRGPGASARPPELRLELPGSMDFLEPFEDAVEGLARARGVPSDEAYGLRIALHEALLNAVLHGSRCDPRRRITLSLRIEAAGLRLSVADQGPGFDPGRVPDPLAEPNLTRGCGRGIFFMRRCMDRVSFSFPRTGGTVVRLRKRLGRTG